MAIEHLCTICSFTSTTLAGVESHMLKHTAEKRWRCDLCQKGHNTKLAMQTHRMTHTGERPNKCPTCGKGFIQSYHMIDHMRKDHNMAIEHKKKDKKPKEEARARQEQVAPPPVDLEAAVSTWRASLSASLWPQGLPLCQAFLSPNYLSSTTRLRLATEMKKALLPLREQGDREGGYYLYTLHDPSLTPVSFHDLAAQLDRHTKFQVFLASLFYIGFGKDDRDLTHFSRTQATRNPKKMDRIEDIQEAGREVYIHRFSRGLNRDQGRYLEALALRATRLGGHLTNLKEERPRGGDPGAPAALHQLMGTQVLWEASRTFGQQGEDIVRSGAFLQCGLCVQAGSLTVYRTTDRAGLSMHQKLRHTEYDMTAPCRKFALPRTEDWARLEPGLGVDMAELSLENSRWLESKNLSAAEPALELINPEDAEGCSKFARKGRGYSTAEEHRLVEHLLVRDRLERRDWSVGGNAVWRVMEEQGVLPGRWDILAVGVIAISYIFKVGVTSISLRRSWQSMKERFRRVILRKVARGVYNYPFTKVLILRLQVPSFTVPCPRSSCPCWTSCGTTRPSGTWSPARATATSRRRRRRSTPGPRSCCTPSCLTRTGRTSASTAPWPTPTRAPSPATPRNTRTPPGSCRPQGLASPPSCPPTLCS